MPTFHNAQIDIHRADHLELAVPKPAKFLSQIGNDQSPMDLAASELGVIVGDASIRDGARPNSGLGDELSVL